MVEKSYILAVDLGTTKIKLAIFDTRGNLVDYTFSNYPLEIEKGYVEQDPHLWIEGFEKGINRLKQRGNLRYIEAITVIGQAPTLVFLGGDGEIIRNAILWLDKRGESEKDILSELGLPFDPRYQSLAQILWIYHNEPDVYERTRYFLQPYDLLNFYLTGEVSSSGIPFRDYLPWSPADAELLGLDPEKFVDITPMGKVVGTLKRGLMKEWGVEGKEVLVIAGGIDFIGALIGTDTTSPGKLCDRGGGSEGITVCSQKPLPEKEQRVSSVPFFISPFWKISGLTNTSGKAIDWIKDIFSIKTYQELVRYAKHAPYGSKGLIFLPYLSGERSPHWDPHAKGIFFGLTLSHTREDMIRAVMEGIVYSIRDIYEIITSYGISIRHFRTTGGLSKSDFFNQIKADIIGIPVEVPYISDGELVGAACIGALGMGVYRDIKEASSAMYKARRTLYPDPIKKERYDELFSLYRELYPSLAPKFHR